MSEAVKYVIRREQSGVVCEAIGLSKLVWNKVDAKRPIAHVALHSPTGFETGYGGSGPADLAASILADFFDIGAELVVLVYRGRWGSHTSPEKNGKAAAVCAYHQIFKMDFIEREQLDPGEAYEITREQIETWAARVIERRPQAVAEEGVKP